MLTALLNNYLKERKKGKFLTDIFIHRIKNVSRNNINYNLIFRRKLMLLLLLIVNITELIK
jgi:hypothetical protein